ncbi:MAG: NPP1 family protein [Bacteroidota bacterium]
MAEFNGLPDNASDLVKKWAIVFDFDTDSCYPAAAISGKGKVNKGLEPTGDRTGGCRELDQFKQSNTYCRFRYVINDSGIYLVIMYALYFEKDQWSTWTPTSLPGSHRHDWEYGLVWLKNGKLTHASYSAHGDAHTKSVDDLYFDKGMENHVKLVYHQDNVRTHAMRFAKEDESPENDLGKWVTPVPIQWEWMYPDHRDALNDYDFGDAHFPVKDENFFTEITDADCIPDGYPSEDDWKNNSYYSLDKCWCSLKWDDIGEGQQKEWEKLGWSSSNWDNEFPIPETRFKDWSELSDEGRDAASKLGYTQWAWDNTDPIEFLSVSYGIEGGKMMDPEKLRDVIGKKFGAKEYNFPVNKDSLGEDPDPGKKKTLTIKYKIGDDGKEITVSAEDHTEMKILG